MQEAGGEKPAQDQGHEAQRIVVPQEVALALHFRFLSALRRE